MIQNKIMEIYGCLKIHGDFYSIRPREEMLKAFATKLSYHIIPDVRDALQAIGEDAPKSFPPLREIREQIRIVQNLKPKNRRQCEVEYDRRLKVENKHFEEIKKQALDLIGSEAIEKYFQKWIEKRLGLGYEKGDLKLTFDKNFFFKPALIDLAEANLNPVRALELSQKKENIAVKQIENYNAPITQNRLDRINAGEISVL